MTAHAPARADQLDAVEDGARWSRERLLTLVMLILAVGGVVLLGSLTSDTFLTADNARAVVRTASITGLVAVMATSVTLSGNFFSIALGQTAVFGSVVFAIVLRAGGGFGLAVAATAGAALLIGTSQGVVVYLGANPIIATLGASALLAGIAGTMTGAGKIETPANAAVDWLGSGQSLGVPSQTWAFLAAVVVMTVVMRRLRLGRAIVLSGANRAAAVASGIRIWLVTVAVFVLASIAAAVAGVFQVAQFNQATLDTFTRLDFDVVAAILVGGTAVGGGEGSPLRSALGALFIGLVDNYMLLKGWSQGTRVGVLGLFVIGAALFFHLLRRHGRVTA
jgi:simple sugar transport system permease protein/ribose transport system permease protein